MAGNSGLIGTRGVAGRTIVIGSSLWLGACAQLGGLDKSVPEAALTTESTNAQSSQTDLQKAVEYWGKQAEKNPGDLKASLNFARNLKASGEKERALAALQQASLYHAQSRELQGEYGRLALELDQLSLAQSLLESADDPARPDWRIVNARGAALAKQGAYSQAIAQFERAAQLAPGQPSVLNNLAMAYVADGRPDQAEPMLRKAVEAGGDAKVRQNLSLVLGLQGKYDEAKQVASKDAVTTAASADVDYLRKMVRHQPQPGQTAVPAVASNDPRAANTKDAAALRGGITANAPAGSAGNWSTKVVSSTSGESRAPSSLGLKSTSR